jgi:hypothetical protein
MSPHAEPHPDVAGFLLGTLTDEEAVEFARHLDGCGPCRTELEELRWLAGALDDLPPVEPLPEDLERRTFDAIELEAADAGKSSPDGASAGSAGEGSPDGALAGPAGHGKVVPFRRRRESPGRWSARTWAIGAAAAAVLVVALAAGVVSAVRPSSPAPLEVVHLAAPGGGPARATATIHATPTGLTIDLRVTQLATSPAGSFYTCWLVGAGDTAAHQNRVSVGSFVIRAGRSADLHWATGADLRRFPTLGVTLEPDNGNPVHQGPKVLQQV